MYLFTVLGTYCLKNQKLNNLNGNRKTPLIACLALKLNQPLALKPQLYSPFSSHQHHHNLATSLHSNWIFQSLSFAFWFCGKFWKTPKMIKNLLSRLQLETNKASDLGATSQVHFNFLWVFDFENYHFKNQYPQIQSLMEK